MSWFRNLIHSFTHKGFVKAGPVGWIPTLLYIHHYNIYIYELYSV